MSQVGISSTNSQTSLMSPSTPSRAPQNITDHPDIFPSPHIATRDPQDVDINHYASPPVSPLLSLPNNLHNQSSPALSVSNPHTQYVDQSWPTSTYLTPPIPPEHHSNGLVSSASPATTSSVIESMASSDFSGGILSPNDSISTSTSHQSPIPNYYQQHLQRQQQYGVYPQATYQDSNTLQQPYQDIYHNALNPTCSTFHHQHQQQLYGYPEPALVDTVDEKIDTLDDSNETSSSSNKRQRLYWIGGLLITILTGVVIGLIVNMKNKDSRNGSEAGSSGSITSRGSTLPTATWSGQGPSGIPVSLTTTAPNGTSATLPIGIPVVVSPGITSSGQQPTQSSIDSPRPTVVTSAQPPKPTSGGGNDRVETPDLPPLPAKGTCPMLWCEQNYLWWCRDDICQKDGEMKRCKAACTDQFCPLSCEMNNACYSGCQTKNDECNAHCNS
ncbi:hypothetical protein FBU30_002912 [Linnemannia zychae]|nr:hypothetical protein FBU30_002912 [Linnemannia zychae]